MDKYILLIETATPTCSVAIAKNDELLDSLDSTLPNLHANQLTCYIQDLLLRNKLNASDLIAVGVSMGPGSYTGLRIGVSVAKGLCYALDIPLIAINTLDAMADGFSKQHSYSDPTILIPMIDARRMEVYCANYTENATLLTVTEAKIIDSSSFETLQNENSIVLFGSGADKFIELFGENNNITVVQGFNNSARFLVDKACEKFKNQNFEDLVYFEPYYLKEFVATVSKKPIL